MAPYSPTCREGGDNGALTEDWSPTRWDTGTGAFLCGPNLVALWEARPRGCGPQTQGSLLYPQSPEGPQREPGSALGADGNPSPSQGGGRWRGEALFLPRFLPRAPHSHHLACFLLFPIKTFSIM